jgi:alkylated DNA repair protein alkB family protein 6
MFTFSHHEFAGLADWSSCMNLMLSGIMPHKDGPIYHPLVAILSVSSALSLSFYTDLADSKKEGGEAFSLYLQPRSLLLFSEECYTNYFHSIVEVWLQLHAFFDDFAFSPFKWKIFLFWLQRTKDIIDEKCINRVQAGVNIGDIQFRRTRYSLTIRHVPLAPLSSSSSSSSSSS